MRTLDKVVAEIENVLPERAPELERARKAYDWVVKRIRYDYDRKNAIDRGLDSGKPHQPEEVLQSGKGTCADLAVLYMTIGSKLDLDTGYARVERDEQGKQICHACAIVHLFNDDLLVDPTLRIFDAKHQAYYACQPEVLQGVMQACAPFPLSRLVKPATALILAGAAWLCGQYVLPMLQRSNITYIETDGSARFVTKHGDVRFTTDADVKPAWKEALFFTEALRGDAKDPDMLDALLRADADGNNRIVKEEADDARVFARAAYLKSRH